ncbi:hypothetical protein PIB30_072912 [Stylosanthes scabra]|uniref:Uncharacterized protein n=1 Tax=Stylosanthes scabra TaxID=79078 RepID=A0ABU6RPH6_9FABA|nr:hypothetical protein [Stylosanthes scabra]
MGIWRVDDGTKAEAYEEAIWWKEGSGVKRNTEKDAAENVRTGMRYEVISPQNPPLAQPNNIQRNDQSLHNPSKPDHPSLSNTPLSPTSNPVLPSPTIPNPTSQPCFGDTMVVETPLETMDIAMNAEPPDPGDFVMTGSELDEIIAQGTEAVVAYGDRIPCEGRDMELV